jgi:hypothetical protein
MRMLRLIACLSLATFASGCVSHYTVVVPAASEACATECDQAEAPRSSTRGTCYEKCPGAHAVDSRRCDYPLAEGEHCAVAREANPTGIFLAALGAALGAVVLVVLLTSPSRQMSDPQP